MKELISSVASMCENSFALEEVSFPKLVNIPDSCLLQCSSLVTHNFSSAQLVGPNAFQGTALENITWPSIIEIGSEAFKQCENLQTASFTNVETIEDYAFVNCTQMTSIILPATTTILSYAFYNCFALTNIYIPVIALLGNNVFSSIAGNNVTLTIPAAMEFDPNVVELQSNNTVTLILV